MHWNHRIVDLSDETDEWFAICEVYYDHHDVPCCYTEGGVKVDGFNMDELRTTLERMKKALDLPILKKEDFKGQMYDDTAD